MSTTKAKASKANSKSKAPFVIVRTVYAGVHCGTLVKQDSKEVVLSNARRVWRWNGANTLNEMSQKGVAEQHTRISEPVPTITLLDAIEIIPCTSEAQANLERSRWGA